MNKIKTIIIAFCIAFSSNIKASNLPKDTLVVIKTIYGTIKIKLYEDTPLHRHNFIKLAQKGFYDSTLFHRVIPGFMIQGGDPDSKHAKLGGMLGNGDIGYTIPAEFRANHYHKKGALAGAREGDEVNPTKASSGCQFYIVQGRKFTEQDMFSVETRMNNSIKQSIFMQFMSKPENESLKNRFIANQQTHNNDSLAALSKIVQPFVDAEFAKTTPFKYTVEQKKTYAEDGGAPHLDGGYTVFGEVIEGLDVVDKIAAVECDGANRPKDDLRILVTLEYINQ